MQMSIFSELTFTFQAVQFSLLCQKEQYLPTSEWTVTNHKIDDNSEHLMCWKITLMDLFILRPSCCCCCGA